MKTKRPPKRATAASSASASATVAMRGAAGATPRPDPPDEVGQRGECRAGAAEAADQLAVGDRADVLAADQAQAGDVVGGGERGGVARRAGLAGEQAAHFAPIRLSVPARRRRILSACLRISSAAIAQAATVHVPSSGTVVRATVNSTAAATAASIPPTDE